MRFLTAMLVVVAIAAASVVWGDKAGSELVVQDEASLSLKEKPKARVCPGSRRALAFYRAEYTRHRKAMWLGGAPPYVRYGCAATRRRAVEWREKASEARAEHGRFVVHHFHWWVWLPGKWQRVGACETGYGRRPGDFNWDSGRYVSAFGIYRPAYAQFAHRVGQLSWDETVRRRGQVPTPREQFEVALGIWREYGFSGWGCRGA